MPQHDTVPNAPPLIDNHFVSIIAGAVFLGVLLRLAIVMGVPTVPTADAWSYFQRAQSLADHWTYEAIPGLVDATFPPAYPLLLSVVFRLTDHRLMAAKLVNLVLAGLSIVFTALLAARLFGRRTGMVCAFLVAFYPRFLFMPCVIASENLQMALLPAWVLVLLAAETPLRARRWSMLAGLGVGLLTLTRSVNYLLWLLWPVAALLRREPWRKVLTETLVVLVVLHAVVAPWAIRNLISLGELSFLNSMGGVQLFIGNNEHANGSWYPWDRDINALDPKFGERPVSERNRVAQSLAVEWMRNHPGRVLELYLKKWQILFADERDVVDSAVFYTQVVPPFPPSDVLPGPHILKKHQQQVVNTLNAWYWLVSFLQLVGIAWWLGPAIARARGGPPPSVIFIGLASAVYFPAVSAVFLASSRLRWSTTDILMPLAAFALVASFDFVRRFRHRSDAERTRERE